MKREEQERGKVKNENEKRGEKVSYKDFFS